MDHGEMTLLGNIIRASIGEGIEAGFASMPQPLPPTSDEELRSMELLRQITEASDIEEQRDAAFRFLQKFVGSVKRNQRPPDFARIKEIDLRDLHDMAKALLNA